MINIDNYDKIDKTIKYPETKEFDRLLYFDKPNKMYYAICIMCRTEKGYVPIGTDILIPNRDYPICCKKCEGTINGNYSQFDRTGWDRLMELLNLPDVASIMKASFDRRGKPGLDMGNPDHVERYLKTI